MRVPEAAFFKGGVIAIKNGGGKQVAVGQELWRNDHSLLFSTLR